jgi:glycosyltransferase involved in cell wall biosynthesis
MTALDRSRVVPSALFAYDGVYAEDLRNKGIEVFTMGRKVPFVWRLNRFLLCIRLVWLMRRFDVLHVHSVKMAAAALVAKLFGGRVIFHLHELPRRVGWLLRAAMAAADGVVYCSETCAKHFAAVPVKTKRTIVNAMQFSDQPPVVHRKENRRIAMIASINRNKGQDLLLNAFACLRNRDAELWLYGTTGLSAHKFVHDLKRFAAQPGLKGRVFFPGPTADVFKVFADVAVLVHTSWTESFGMALVEAQSCGVPVIAHDLEGMREVVENEVSGFLVAPGNVQELAGRLDELLANPDLRNKMGTAGYHMVRERFNIQSRLPDHLELYQEVCRI